MVTYQALATEYYDRSRHPTSANFREASSLVLNDWLSGLSASAVICEIGAGDSVVAELLFPRRHRLDSLVITDVSPSMLEYARRWEKHGARLLLGDAFDLPLGNRSVDCAVACLGDPYNTAHFWVEVERILRERSICMFTTPSYEWARAFRSSQEDKSVALFELQDGQVVSVPSYIYPTQDQVAMIESNHLVVEDIAQISRAGLGLDSVISPKLEVLEGPDAPIVTAYYVRSRS